VLKNICTAEFKTFINTSPNGDCHHYKKKFITQMSKLCRAQKNLEIVGCYKETKMLSEAQVQG
jgi:hypothetical protein